ncbi:unnamed protein product [Lampetra fluviatilis]
MERRMDRYGGGGGVPAAAAAPRCFGDARKGEELAVHEPGRSSSPPCSSVADPALHHLLPIGRTGSRQPPPPALTTPSVAHAQLRQTVRSEDGAGWRLRRGMNEVWRRPSDGTIETEQIAVRMSETATTRKR